MIKVTRLITNSETGKFKSTLDVLNRLEEELDKFIIEKGYKKVTDYDYEIIGSNKPEEYRVTVSCEAEVSEF